MLFAYLCREAERLREKGRKRCDIFQQLMLTLIFSRHFMTVCFPLVFNRSFSSVSPNQILFLSDTSPSRMAAHLHTHKHTYTHALILTCVSASEGCICSKMALCACVRRNTPSRPSRWVLSSVRLGTATGTSTGSSFDTGTSLY